MFLIIYYVQAENNLYANCGCSDNKNIHSSKLLLFYIVYQLTWLSSWIIFNYFN